MNTMTTLTFIKKHGRNQEQFATMLDMSLQSFSNKLHGNGKSKPFTEAEIDTLNHYIMTVGDDVQAVKRANINSLRSVIAAKTEAIRALEPIR